MITALIGLALKAGIPAKYAKVAVFVVLAIAAVAAFALLKSCYDNSIIDAHDNKREATIAKEDRKADATAAVERRADDARLTKESQEVKEAINEARSEGRDPRAAYYECIRLQQQARARNQPSPDC
jgi:hypothetical protein